MIASVMRRMITISVLRCIFRGIFLPWTQLVHRKFFMSIECKREALTGYRYGLGLNPPALVNIYHTPGTTMLFLHEYGKTNASYNWYPASGCNNADKPIYMCVAGLDPSYSSKFSAIKSILEQVSNTDEFPCKVEVIDAVPYAQDQDPMIPCTGILREYNDPGRTDMRHGGNSEGAPNWAWEMPDFMNRAVMLATETDPGGTLVKAFEEAIDVALCKDWNSDVEDCGDDDDIAA